MAQKLHRIPLGGLPSDTMDNSKGKDRCCAITLRSGTMVENMVERSKASEGSAAKKLDVMEEEIQAYIKKKIKEDKKARLGENNMKA